MFGSKIKSDQSLYYNVNFLTFIYSSPYKFVNHKLNLFIHTL
jgi:hypothetical protein